MLHHFGVLGAPTGTGPTSEAARLSSASLQNKEQHEICSAALWLGR